MPAVARQTAATALDRDLADPSWPACEEQELPGDGSLRWLGAVLLGGSGLVTLRMIYWLAQTAVTHL